MKGQQKKKHSTHGNKVKCGRCHEERKGDGKENRKIGEMTTWEQGKINGMKTRSIWRIWRQMFKKKEEKNKETFENEVKCDR